MNSTNDNIINQEDSINDEENLHSNSIYNTININTNDDIIINTNDIIINTNDIIINTNDDIIDNTNNDMIINTNDIIINTNDDIIVNTNDDNPSPTKRRKINTYEPCSICLGPMNDNDAILKLRCSHTFHYHCLYRSSQFDTRDIAKCPICRSDMVAPDHTNNHEERNLFSNRNETTYTTNTPNLTNILNRYGSLTNYINNYNITNDTQRQQNYVSRSTLHREYTPMLPSVTRLMSVQSL